MIVKKYLSMRKCKACYDTIVGGIHGGQSYDVLKSCDSFFYRVCRHSAIINYVVIDDEGNVVLIAPLRKLDNDTMIIAGDQERFDFVDMIYSDSDEKQLTEGFKTLLAYLKQRGVKNILWRYLDECSVTKKILQNENLTGYVRWKDLVDNVRIMIKSKDYDTFFKSLTKHQRQNIRTAYNRISNNKAAWRFVAFTSSTEYMNNCLNINSDYGRKVIRQCMDVYVKRQKERYKKKGTYIRVLYNRYFHYITRAIRGNNGFMAVFFINNEIAGFMQGFITKSAIEIPRLAINSEYSFYSPGLLLVNETIKHMMDNSKMQYLDLCRGTEKYKLDMGGVIYQTQNLEIILK